MLEGLMHNHALNISLQIFASWNDIDDLEQKFRAQLECDSSVDEDLAALEDLERATYKDLLEQPLPLRKGLCIVSGRFFPRFG